jgi:hypothetical protein
LAFLDVMASFGEVPSLCICLSALTHDGWRLLAERARAGQVDVSPHVHEPEAGIFNLAEDKGSQTDGEIARRIRELFAGHGCPMAMAVSDHNHEITARGVRLAAALGMKSRMNVLRIGETWDGVHRDWHPAPFGRLNYALDRFVDAPDLFVAINHHHSFADSFTHLDSDHFLCTTFGGFTDDRWDFLNGLVDDFGRKELDHAAERLLAHAELGLNSLFFVGAISHTHFIRHLSNADWERVLSVYRSYVDQHGYLPRSYDGIASYAAWRSRLGEVDFEARLAGDDGRLWGILAEEERGVTKLTWAQLASTAS